MTNFPLPDDYGKTTVPNAVLESLLHKDADVGQIIFALRVLWWLDRSTSYPKSAPVSDLRTDRTLIASLGTGFDAAMDATCKRGIFIRTGTDRLLLNTVSVARSDGHVDDRNDNSANGWDSVASSPGPADAYRAYEQNIGQLTPMIRETISQSLQDFTDAQITQAIRIAVENDARSWAFIKAVLNKWNSEGIPDARQSRGDTGTARIPEAELREYLERTRTQ